jgi:hypothetical protein
VRFKIPLADDVIFLSVGALFAHMRGVVPGFTQTFGNKRRE